MSVRSVQCAGSYCAIVMPPCLPPSLAWSLSFSLPLYASILYVQYVPLLQNVLKSKYLKARSCFFCMLSISANIVSGLAMNGSTKHGCHDHDPNPPSINPRLLNLRSGAQVSQAHFGMCIFVKRTTSLEIGMTPFVFGGVGRFNLMSSQKNQCNAILNSTRALHWLQRVWHLHGKRTIKEQKWTSATSNISM